MRELLLNECAVIEDYCVHNAETHHIVAVNERRVAMALRVIPAIATALGGSLALIYPDIDGYAMFTVAAAVTTALSSVLNLDKSYASNLESAKNFTILKHDARVLREVFHKQQEDQELSREVKRLLDRYKDIIRSAPPTNDGAFKKARENIKDGRHKSGN